MKKNSIGQLIITGSIFWNIQAVQAGDVGMPLYEGDIEGKKGSLELYSEHHQQDHISNEISYSVPTPEYDYNGSYLEDVEDDRYVARMSYYVSPKLAFYAELGTADFVDSREKSFLFGAGIRTKVYAGRFFDVSLSGSMTYVPEVTNQGVFPNTPQGDMYAFWEYSYSEINGSLTVSKIISSGSDWKLMPYGGITITELLGDVDSEVVYQTGQQRKFFGITDLSLEEDEAVSGFAGLGLVFSDTWGIKAEGRFGGQESYSGGLTYFF
ncbi:MAG: hypothetical protein D3904_07910 [Candidatus Electrothrix sp. EH2]|nr:hypothetical protein [Candidatus Electrothrix sp. EH2]